MHRTLAAALACVIAACAGELAVLPGASAQPSAGTSVSATRLVLPGTRGDLDCEDLADQASAQAMLRADAADPHGLDADRDGIACEELPPPRDDQPVAR